MEKTAIETLVRTALQEDIGTGDVTAQLIPAGAESVAVIISREAAVIAGCPFVEEVMRQIDSNIRIEWQVSDGDQVAPDDTLCVVRGNSRALLTAERTALNFLQTLSGTATLTRAYVRAIGEHKARVLDTRKTIPGLRLAQKYAVTCGGGHNHRVGLFDAFLIKENHIHAAGSISAAVEEARKIAPDILLEVEVETFAQLDEALACGVKRILLDNFSLDELRKAVAIAGEQADLEASGNIDLNTIGAVAATGVDFISTGSITKHVTAIDLSMRFRDA
ncbi:carboxylating nicotinate-nucleotide diphosphorylase [Granulosicoccaceae sp. 1_MG-2023]|nr:carboxylating nicotinate-nucleotide diphosphorylase [Granulosicoccaceae sp. 1_MG-2023]